MEIGLKLRLLRTTKGLTLTQVAEAAGLSPSFISQVERGLTNPSVNSLKRIGDVLGIPIASLFNHDQQSEIHGIQLDNDEKDNIDANDVRIVRRDHRKGLVWPGENAKSELLTPDLQRKFMVTLNVVDSGCEIAMKPYSHKGEEFALVLEGRYEITIADKTYILEEGDSIYFPSHLLHSSRTIGDKPARTLWIIAPPSF